MLLAASAFAERLFIPGFERFALPLSSLPE
jgi:hypothetical protein